MAPSAHRRNRTLPEVARRFRVALIRNQRYRSFDAQSRKLQGEPTTAARRVWMHVPSASRVFPRSMR
jgi:hypothetical protein